MAQITQLLIFSFFACSDECESVIVKTLKELKQLPDEQKNCRLDLILEFNSNDRFFE
jgi:hypothetical protein